MADFKFDLISNAVDSIHFAIQVLINGDDVGTEESVLKQAIVSSAHCIELLLKERLRREHPAFIWRNIDKYPNTDAFTIDTDAAVKRLGKLTSAQISDTDKKIIKDLRTARNNIEHFEWHTTHSEAEKIVATSMAFAFSFSKRELNQDISEPLRRDEIWVIFIERLNSFAEEYGNRIACQQRESGEWTVWCDECGQETVPIGGGVCMLCGHWQDDENEIE